MAWIESHQELAEHPKTKRLAKKLGISIAQTIGHLHLFWWWSMNYAEDGDLSNFDHDEIADAAHWESDPEEFINAMVNCGPGSSRRFLEFEGDKLYVHNWQEYIGRLVEKREKNRQRKRKERQIAVQESAEEIIHLFQDKTAKEPHP
jgi:hypothetical protein